MDSFRVCVPMITIELFKEEMKFSAGHFTIFAAGKRERLHGHNFTVWVSLAQAEAHDGLVFDYGEYKVELRRMCAALNEVFLLPGSSPHLRLRPEGEYLWIEFGGKALRFLADDAKILPLPNITVETLSGYLLEQLLAFRASQGHDEIAEVVVKVFSGSGQCGVRRWSAGA